MNLKFAFDFTVERFKKKHLENFDLEARWLISGVLKVPETAIWSDSKRKLSKDEVMKLSEVVEERLKGKPLAYIIGEQGFYGRRFEVDSNVLIPRPETEMLVEMVLKIVSKNASLRICDMGTGSGCIGLTLLAELPLAQLTTIDISPIAIEVAKKNATSIGVIDRAEFLFGSVAPSNFQEGSFDVVVANPPYISQDDPEVEDHVRKFEPHIALFAPENGLKLIFDWLKVTAHILKPGGFFVFEIGRNQADSVTKFTDNLKSFKVVRVIKDLNSHDRFVMGLRL